MNILLIVTLTLLASAAAVAGYRADKNGWAPEVRILALVVRIIWVINLSAVVLASCAQAPVPESLIVTCFFLSAGYLPWWCGIATSALVNKQ